MLKPISPASFSLSKNARWVAPLTAIAAVFSLSLLLAWISSGFTGLQGWLSFLALGLIAAGLLWLGWWLIREEAPPRWLAGLMVGAALLRLAAGVLWFVALPAGGWGSEGERQGYVMADAAFRDPVAWDLASSGKPLSKAFANAAGYRKADQYGGLLFISSLVYRFLGGGVHRPLLMVVLAAACSALTVIFGWAFARRAWGATAAGFTAWGLALYPEAVLLGSSQMREAFIMPLVAAAAYGLVRYRREHTWTGLAWILVALLLFLPFSPPAAALLMALLGLLAIFTNGERVRQDGRQARRFWLALAILSLVALGGIWITWRRFAPEAISNPLALINWWLRESAQLQAHRAELASGWIQKVFNMTPDWMEVPLLLAYGVAQPFLPAALADVDTAPMWYLISIWRSIGWAALLPFLVYAPLRLLSPVGSASGRRMAAGLCLVVWIGILLASLRGGADAWDNPRYRVMWVVLQGALAAWVWAMRRGQPDAWLRRAMVGLGLILAWFLPWYLRRYLSLDWPVVDVFKTFGLGLASAVLFSIWDWARVEGNQNKQGIQG